MERCPWDRMLSLGCCYWKLSLGSCHWDAVTEMHSLLSAVCRQMLSRCSGGRGLAVSHAVDMLTLSIAVPDPHGD